MTSRKNAALTPKGRARLVQEIDRVGPKPAAKDIDISTRTAREWRGRDAAWGAADLVERSSQRRHSPRPKNVSCFACTATPESKTLDLFGRPGADGLPVPFQKPA